MSLEPNGMSHHPHFKASKRLLAGAEKRSLGSEEKRKEGRNYVGDGWAG